MQKMIIIGMLCLLFAGCVTSTVAPTITAPPPTSTALPPTPTITALPPTSTALPPTPTVTPIPLADLDLEPLILLSGEIIEGVRVQRVMDIPEDDPEVPIYPGVTNFLFMQYFYKGKFDQERLSGDILVYLFENLEDRNQAFAPLDTSQELKTDGIGELAIYKSYLTTVNGEERYTCQMRFVICHAMVRVRFFNFGAKSLVNYARSLSERLAPLVCR